MQAAPAAAASGQRDVERLGRELALELRLGERLRGGRSSAASMRCLAALISAPRAFFSSAGKRAERLQQLGDAAALPRKRALAFSSSAGVRAAANSACALSTTGFEIVHRAGDREAVTLATAFERRRSRSAGASRRRQASSGQELGLHLLDDGCRKQPGR